jgi:hypothetical protein
MQKSIHKSIQKHLFLDGKINIQINIQINMQINKNINIFNLRLFEKINSNQSTKNQLKNHATLLITINLRCSGKLHSIPHRIPSSLLAHSKLPAIRKRQPQDASAAGEATMVNEPTGALGECGQLVDCLGTSFGVVTGSQW